jgi:hypothetical protein
MPSINYTHPHVNGFMSEGGTGPDNLYDNFSVRRVVTIPAGNGVIARGTALGKITANGKWVKSAAAATDGSQVIRAIMLHDVDATAADVEGVVGRIGSCNPNAIILGAGHTLASIEDACMDRGIVFERVIGA